MRGRSWNICANTATWSDDWFQKDCLMEKETALRDFSVDPIISSVTHTLTDWPLSRVFLYNDARYHWGLLVPRRAGLTEICDLEPADQAQMMAEIVSLSKIVRALPGVEKLNVGYLGIAVPQLHVHVVGRFKGDPAWPGPVWGHSPPQPWASADDAPLGRAMTAAGGPNK
jgi:diadenosine tetraphosphate (Ap4A) HIT family hydrolase